MDEYEAAQGYARNPEHAVQMMHERADNSTEAFLATVEQQAGVSLSDQYAELNGFFFMNVASSAPFAYIDEATQNELLDILPKDIPMQVIEAAWDDALMANTRYVTVYGSDGSTVIGEFAIGYFR